MKKTKKNDFAFSIIMAIYNSESYLNEAIDSVINQSIGFEENIELILVDDGSEDNSKEICFEYLENFPNNIKYLYQENQGQAVARNNGMKIATGKIFNFLDSDDKFELRAIELVNDFFKKNYNRVDVVSLPIKFFDRQTGDHILNYKYHTTRLVDLIKEPNYIQLQACSTFFKKDSIGDITFDKELIVSEDAKFINKILLKKKRLGVISNTAYFYRKRLSQDSTVDTAITDKDYYIKRSKKFFKELFDYSKENYGEIFDFIKYTVIYDLQWIFNTNNIEEILKENELKELKQILYDLLQEIDDEIILNQKYHDKNLKYSMLIFKHNTIDTKVLLEEKNVQKLVNDNIIDELYYHVFYLDAIEIHQNQLNILGFLKSYFIYPEIKIQAIKFSKEGFLEYWVNFFNKNKVLFFKREFLNTKGLLLKDALLNEIDINNKNLRELLELDSEIQLMEYIIESEKNRESEDINDIIYKIDEEYSLNYILDEFLNSKFVDKKNYDTFYEKIQQKFCELEGEIFESENISYPYREKKYLDLNYIPFYNFDLRINLNDNEDSLIKIRVVYESLNFYLNIKLQKYVKLSKESYYSKKGDYIIKIENNTLNIFNFTINDLIKLEEQNIKYLESKGNSNLTDVINFRKAYLYSIFKYAGRRIWLFMDRIEVADDNAEHLFKYALKQKDNIEKYFVLSEDSKDYGRMCEIGKVVIAGSEEHKLLSCHAEKIISSHADDNVVNPFNGKNEIFYNGLISAKVYFLQHGVIKEDISSWLHKYDKFLYLIVTSAKDEYDSFFNNDTFYNYDKSVVQLLGLPRHDYLNKLEDKKEIVLMPSWRRSLHYLSEEEFINTSFFETYNNLLNDEELIEFLNKKGYKLIFKPHPNIYKYIHLFDKNESVFFDSYESDVEESISYNDIFNHSSLIITDFSSTVFDFALLKKPIIYYHYEKDYHFDIEKGYFDYETMGFGEIVDTHNDLINLIFDYINNNCEMKEFYKLRVDNFFEFQDKNNCKRVYDFIFDDNTNLQKIKNQDLISENKELKAKNEELTNNLIDWGEKLYNLSTKKNTQDLNNRISLLNKEINQKNNHINNLHKQIGEKNEIIESMYSSNSWRITKPLREIRKFFKKNG